jgi:hypothetical protein
MADENVMISNGGPAISAAHLSLAWIVGGAGAAVTLVAALGWVRPPINRLWLDRTILLAEAAIVLGVLSGGTVLAAGSRPTDPLHYLYAAIALLALPVVRAWGGPLAGRRPGVMLLGSLVLLGVTLRLFQTGS